MLRFGNNHTGNGKRKTLKYYAYLFNIIITLFFLVMSLSAQAKAAESSAQDDTILNFAKGLSTASEAASSSQPAPAQQPKVKAASPSQTVPVPTPQPEVKDTENSGDVNINKAYFKGYLTDTAHILTSPRNWDKWDWLTATLVVGTAVGLYSCDKNIKTWVQDNKGDTTDKISTIVRPFGDGYYSMPALGLFYLFGFATDNSKAKTTALLGMESFLVSGAFTQILKYTTHRSRPNETDNSDNWNGPSFSSSSLSFVSGEATSVFSVATVIATEYQDTVWVPVLAYSIATLTALARIPDNGHWSSDVFLGSAIGYFTAKTIVRLHKKKSNLEIIPIMGDNFNAVAIAWRF